MTGKKTGVFYGVGVGPGDPELVTVKAVRVLEGASVIAVPRSLDSSTDSQGHALSIVKKAVRLEGKEILELPLPMTKDKALLHGSRAQAAAKIAGQLREGKDVAFITLGDPMLYSTFSYLVPFVKDALPHSEVRVVPGVTAFSAAAARACAPIAEAHEKVVIIPASYRAGDVKKLLADFDTIVLMKVHKAMDAMIDMLTEEGLADKAFFVTKIGWPEEEIVSDIRTLKGKKLDYFSMLFIKAASKN